MTAPLTDGEFGSLLAGIECSAFRLEVREFYAIGCEREFLDRFLAGDEPNPDEYTWYRAWLNMISSHAAAGRAVSRVRVLAEPPSDYQRSELWADPWHAEAGERIGYMPVSRARAIGLPLDREWWLLDNERVIDMRYTHAGGIASRTLITSPDDITAYREWRDLAVSNATPAAEIAAA